jgi:hypothetical protein
MKVAKLPGALLAGAFLGAGAWALAQPGDSTSRYPYDPACPWGRISNGRGMIVRCISRQEAEQLFARSSAPGGSAAASGAPPASAAAASAGAASSAVAVAVPDPGLTVSVGPVRADEGKLPLAEKKLAAPRDRYAECVAKAGGLSGPSGEVHVRFLVRARGRAEGVSVAKRVGVTPEAARCVAEVVDRRPVGTPDVPMVGATVVIKFAPAPRAP